MIGDPNYKFKDVPGFHTRDATLDDVDDITRLWYSSFAKSHKFFDYCTPDDPESRAWFNQVWTMGIKAGSSVLRTLVVEDLSKDRKLVAFSRTHLPQPDGSQEIPMPDLPSTWDPEINDALWGGMVRNRAEIMGRRLHWMGEFIGVDAPYQKLGVGRPMLEWICDQADDTGLEVYFDASVAGFPIYKKHYRFVAVKVCDIPTRPEAYGSYAVVSMVRQPKKPDFKSLL